MKRQSQWQQKQWLRWQRQQWHWLKWVVWGICFVCFQPHSVKAEPFQDAFRFGTYGLVAGALAGGTLMALSDDPGSHLKPIAKGASLGLYAGLAVAIYQNTRSNSDKEIRYDVRPMVFKGNDGALELGLNYRGTF